MIVNEALHHHPSEYWIVKLVAFEQISCALLLLFQLNTCQCVCRPCGQCLRDRRALFCSATKDLTPRRKWILTHYSFLLPRIKTFLHCKDEFEVLMPTSHWLSHSNRFKIGRNVQKQSHVEKHGSKKGASRLVYISWGVICIFWTFVCSFLFKPYMLISWKLEE